jgi:hypothetical protein
MWSVVLLCFASWMAGAVTLFPNDPIDISSIGDTRRTFNTFSHAASDGETWIVVWDSWRYVNDVCCTNEGGEINFSISNDNGKTWSPRDVITAGPHVGNNVGNAPSIATDKHGKWMIVWIEYNAPGNSHDILYSTSTDSGAHWTSPRPLYSDPISSPGTVLGSKITTDCAGVWMVSWRDFYDGSVHVSTTEDYGETWSSPAELDFHEPVGPNGYLMFESIIETDGEGDWMVIWDAPGTGGANEDDLDIYCAASSDNGVTWSTPVQVNTVREPSNRRITDGFPSLAAGGDGVWIATWASDHNLNGEDYDDDIDYDIVFSVSMDNGASWSRQRYIDANDNDPHAGVAFTEIASDGKGNWVIALQTEYLPIQSPYPALPIALYVSTNDGESWSKPHLLHDDIPSWIVPPPFQLITDDEGNYIVFWHNVRVVNGTFDEEADLFATSFRFPNYTVSVPFYLDNASNLQGGVTPANGTASFIAVKNTSDEPNTLVLTYSDASGRNKTPANHLYELAPNSMVSWRPFADDPVEGNDDGRRVPNATGAQPWGSVTIEARKPITGRLFIEDGVQGSNAMMVLPQGIGTRTLSVPFYLDNAPNLVDGTVPSDGMATFIGVKNMTNNSVTLTLTYTDTRGNDKTPEDNTYVLPGNGMVSWRPFADDPVEGENSGRRVPNAADVNPWGSILIQADGPITGRLITIDGASNSTGMMLLPNG